MTDRSRERRPLPYQAYTECWYVPGETHIVDAVGMEHYRTDVSEISEERFNDALNVLPPVGWTTRQGVESFRISERIWGSITDIYARLGDRYFVLSDDIRLSPGIVADRVAVYAASHPANKTGDVDGHAPERPGDADHVPAPVQAPKPGSGS